MPGLYELLVCDEETDRETLELPLEREEKLELPLDREEKLEPELRELLEPPDELLRLTLDFPEE